MQAKNRTMAALPVLLGLAACAVAGGFAYTFSHFAAYDDEGLLIVLLKRFLGGEALYDRIAVFYGPVYYFYEWAAHGLAGVPVTHASVRFVSLFFWLATAVLLFVLVRRVSGWLLLAAVSFCVGFRVLRFIGSEPAHPQELCVLLLVAVGLAASGAGRWRIPVLGGLAGLMLLTKINLGIFVVLALGLACAWAASGRLLRMARWPLCAAAMLLPVVLMRGHLGESWAQFYCLVVVASAAGVMAASRRLRAEPEVGWGEVLWMTLGFTAAAGAACAFAVLRGSTLSGMFHGLVIGPATTFAGLRYWPSRIRAISMVWAAGAVWLAWAARSRRFPRGTFAILKMGLGAGSALVSVGNLGNDLLGFGLPFQWLVLLPPEEGERSRMDTFGRLVLAFVSVLQSLYAYPVAGSQVWVASIIPLAVGAVCFADGFAEARALWPAQFEPGRLRTAAVCGWVALVALFGGNAAWEIREYRSLEPLGLRGSRYLRLERPRVETLRLLAGDISAHCGTLVSIPTVPSFNLWTGAALPADVSFAEWMAALDDGAQRDLVRRLRATPRVCALYAPGLVDFWMHGADITQRPLVGYLLRDLRPLRTVDGYELLVR